MSYKSLTYVVLQSREQQHKARFTTSTRSRESAHGMIHVFQGIIDCVFSMYHQPEC